MVMSLERWGRKPGERAVGPVESSLLTWFARWGLGGGGGGGGAMFGHDDVRKELGKSGGAKAAAAATPTSDRFGARAAPMLERRQRPGRRLAMIGEPDIAGRV
jgi:hypothetical protein